MTDANADTAPSGNGDGDLVNVNLTGAQATVVIMLYTRALDAQSAKPILGDPYAQKTFERLNFPAFQPVARNRVVIKTTPIGVLRSLVFDDLIREFLAKHDEATVLQLACGLDSRAVRVDWHRPGVRWIDVDVPDVVAIRRQIAHLTPPAPADYTLLDAWAGNDDGWLETVPADRPTLVVAEGLFMYLQPAEANHLISRMVTRFAGRHAAALAGQNLIVFDAVGPRIAWALHTYLWLRPPTEKFRTAFSWTLARAQDLAALHPGIRSVEPFWRWETEAMRRLAWPWNIIGYLGRWGLTRGTLDMIRIRY